jgi:hypothetical protein
MLSLRCKRAPVIACFAEPKHKGSESSKGFCLISTLVLSSSPLPSLSLVGAARQSWPLRVFQPRHSNQPRTSEPLGSTSERHGSETDAEHVL